MDFLRFADDVSALSFQHESMPCIAQKDAKTHTRLLSIGNEREGSQVKKLRIVRQPKESLWHDKEEKIAA
jgi:hypothetical protein